MRQPIIGMTLFMCLTAFSLWATPEGWWSKTKEVKIGDSQQEVQKVMNGFKVENSSQFLKLHERLGFLGGFTTDVWLVDAETVYTKSGETYVIAVYSKDGKVLDLLCFIATSHIYPILEGEYIKRLQSIKNGMNVDDIYRLVGQEKPYQYVRDTKTNKWIVRFDYQGIGRSLWSYNVDAATGEITEAGFSTL